MIELVCTDMTYTCYFFESRFGTKSYFQQLALFSWELTHKRNTMRFLRLKEVMAQTGLGRSSIYKFMDEETFPKSVSLGGRAVAWVESEIQD